MQLNFKVIGQTLTWENPSIKPVANSRGYLKAHFNLPEEYIGLVAAHFKMYQNGNLVGRYAELDENFTCDVPPEIINEGTLYVSVACCNEDLFIPTNHVPVEIKPSGVPVELLPTPDGKENQFEEFNQMYNEVKEAHSEIEALVHAKEEEYVPRLTAVEKIANDIVPKIDLATIDTQTGTSVQSQKADDCFAELKIEGNTLITKLNPDLEISPDNIATIKNAMDFDVLAIGKNWFNIYDCRPGANLTLFDGIFTTAPLGNYGGFSIDTVYSTQLGVNLGISNQSILAGSYTISFKLRLKSGSYNKGLNKIAIWDGNGAQASVIINSNPAISSSFQTYIGSFALDKRFENYGITFQIQTTDSRDVVLEMIDLQIEKGNVTSYEPYKSNKFHIGFELAEGDILEYIGDNKAKLIKKKERVVLDGSDDENWTFLNDNTDYVEYRLPYSMGTTGTLSNINSHFPNTTNSRISLVGNAIYLRFPKNIENYPTDVASLKASLQTSPVTIQYNLATTIETIIELQPIETYKGVTNIYTTADVQPTITAKFKSRLANAVEVLLSETSKLKQAVISLGGTL